MATTILIPEKDPMGAAISDFFNLHRADRLRVFSSQFEEDEIPVKELFRSMPSMPMLERTALQMATGQILDVGAVTGRKLKAVYRDPFFFCGVNKFRDGIVTVFFQFGIVHGRTQIS